MDVRGQRRCSCEIIYFSGYLYRKWLFISFGDFNLMVSFFDAFSNALQMIGTSSTRNKCLVGSLNLTIVDEVRFEWLYQFAIFRYFFEGSLSKLVLFEGGRDLKISDLKIFYARIAIFPFWNIKFSLKKLKNVITCGNFPTKNEIFHHCGQTAPSPPLPPNSGMT